MAPTEPTKECPGCGQEIPTENDLCPDDTMARLDAQSPRVPR